MLEIDRIAAGYGTVQVLRDLNLQAKAGEITCIMGRNGAGKSTLMRTIVGQIPTRSGRILLNGSEIQALAGHEIPRRGVGYVPQGRRLFGPLSVDENLTIGLMTRNRGDETREKVLQLFPRLRERLNQQAATLSGGEQQMLAIARALCLEPLVLLLDEPSEGLQPSMIALIHDTAVQLKESGVAVILVEHRVDAVLRVADQVAFMVSGQIQESCRAADLNRESPQFQRYVGV